MQKRERGESTAFFLSGGFYTRFCLSILFLTSWQAWSQKKYSFNEQASKLNEHNAKMLLTFKSPGQKQNTKREARRQKK